jgi:hypothetical protein
VNWSKLFGVYSGNIYKNCKYTYLLKSFENLLYLAGILAHMQVTGNN